MKKEPRSESGTADEGISAQAITKQASPKWVLSFFLVAVLQCPACTDREPEPAPAPESQPEPPAAEKRPKKLITHGDVRTDNYYWLKQRENPEVTDYLEAENAYAVKMMAPVADLRSTLFEELKSRYRQVDMSVPYKSGDYYYYHRYEKGNQYPIYCRKKGSLDASEEVLFNPNIRKDDSVYYMVRSFSVSPDDSKAMYAVDTVGRRFYTLRFLDLETGKLLPDTIEGVTNDVVWAADSQTILYVKQHPQTLRPYQVYRHVLGVPEDDFVYEEPDEMSRLYLEKSLTGDYLFLRSYETTWTEVSYIPADAPEQPPRVILPRQVGHEYSVADGGDRFYILSNDEAMNFRVMKTSIENPSMENWEVVVPGRENVFIRDFEAFKDYLVIYALEVEDGIPQLEVVDRSSGERYWINFDEPAYELRLSDNYEYAPNTVRYVFSSMITPESTYDFNMSTKERELVHREEIPGYDRSNYRTERLMATARDGARVPISIVYRKGIANDGKNPLLQFGYGSYGHYRSPNFKRNVLSLLDRGFIYTIAHVRGGSILGRDWYFDGRLLNKMNTFTDFIDTSRFLIAEGYTSPEHLYAFGGSAGGMTMGAVANMAPELYHGIVMTVPFIDVVTTGLDPMIPITPHEWSEFGNPIKDEEAYFYMKSYSPYDNITGQAYPNMLVTGGLVDSQVQYWEPAKWVAKLRDNKTDDNLLVLAINMHGGHGGKVGRFEQLRDTALYYSFFIGLERNLFGTGE